METSEFQLNDWVRETNRNVIFKITNGDLIAINSLIKDNKPLHLEIWKPQVGEMIAYPNGEKGFSVSPFKSSYIITKKVIYILENEEVLENLCEPFINKLPTFLQ